MKPVIGITTDVENGKRHVLNDRYIQAVERAGGLPILIPTGIEKDLRQITGLLDGLLLSGGSDLNPLLFGEEPHRNLGDVTPARDQIEIELAKIMLELDKPILGICRGEQILNVVSGGNLYQDIHAQNEKKVLQHAQNSPRGHLTHYVQVEKGSLLESIVGETEILVNSYHHQAVKYVPKPYQISGVSSDGIVEAIESTEHRFVLGVQWHPEELVPLNDAPSLLIFEKFIKASKKSN
ncbi:gamma-glutamyl-gamma-aminobutyrate hydrolase family protein [Sporosarcina sp. CAU 1771]